MRKRVSPLRDQPPLNERQLAYLKAIYACDQEQERAERSAWSRGLTPRPASEWRWISYHATNSPLRRRLLDAQEIDLGTGSTFESLAARHLILRRWERDPELPVSLLFVQMTPKGRKLIRTLTGEQREKPLPPGTLREWHWKALVVAYQAGEEGLRLDTSGSGRYGGMSWQTWLRLRDYTYRGKEQPLIAEVDSWVQVHRRVFSGKLRPDDYEERTVTERVYFLHITPFGRTYYAQHWQRYRQLYPEVEAPDPMRESDVQS